MQDEPEWCQMTAMEGWAVTVAGWRFLAVSFLIVGAAMPRDASAAAFDGTWTVVQDCQAAPDGARAYKWTFDAVVKDGNLVGEYGTRGKPASQTLTGTIGADGSARLLATGLNGNPDHVLGYQQPGSSFTFPVTAKFSGAKGTGTRTAGRTCTFTFTKR